ncbi:MAG TPA: outer membrane lipoprotein carrier protein LolA [Bacteroidales bacterium]|nr:MAG: lipoprotein chaperone [Bacteroidetes bacterium ADurb.Bin041]HNV50691.1 outer membrane lipoprotein carrier protein LolA [Bacteroidales bacterium]HPW43633.1 outer membrane lipoprotein carrier protein LolA [Bacteroidales bacterium]
MRNLVLWLIPFFVVFQTAFLFAQSRDKQASEILDEVISKTKSYKSMKLEFIYKMENPEANINETTTGKAVVSDDSYRVEVAGQTIISDGKTLWTVISDAEEVQVNDVSENDDVFTPTKLLTSYNKQYKSKLLPKVTSLHGKNVYGLELTPYQKKSYDRVHFFIEKDKMQLYQIEIFDRNGSKYTYQITKFETNVQVNEKSFSFSEKEFPGFYIIDMR